MTCKGLSNFLKNNKINFLLGVVIAGGIGYLVGRWIVARIIQSHGTTKQSDEIGRKEINRIEITPNKPEPQINQVKSLEQTPLIDRNKSLREQIQNLKIQDFTTTEMQQRMEKALLESVVAHCIFENVFLGGQWANVFGGQGRGLNITYLLSASIYTPVG